MACIGYVRIGPMDEDPAVQLDALAQAGCDRIFEDRVGPGLRVVRPALNKAFAWLRPGDVLVVWRLDRLGRSLSHLVATLADLEARGVGFRSLSGPIDTTVPGGEAVLPTLRALAYLKRETTAEQTNVGLEVAIAGGKRRGRPPVMTLAKFEQARTLIEGGASLAEAARRVNVSRTSLYQRLPLLPREPGGRARATVDRLSGVAGDEGETPHGIPAIDAN